MNQNMLAVYIVLIVGAVILLAAIFNWELLMNSKRMSKVNNKYGNLTSRIIFAVLGILVLLMGYYLFVTRKLDTYQSDPIFIQF